MELLQLYYFVEVAEKEHLTKVAEKLYVSPSAISCSISRLESELGVKLFDRVGRSIKLNDKGIAYFHYAKRALQELDEGKQALSEMVNSEAGVLNVVMPNPYLWMNAISGFTKKHPDIILYHSLFDPVTSGVKLPSSKADCMIASPDSFYEPDWDFKLLFTDRVALAVPPDHKFAKRKSIFLGEAKNEKFINLSDCTFARFSNELCEKAGFTPNVRATCDYMVRPQIALSENAVAITTGNVKQSGLFNNMVFVPLADENAKRQQAIFYPSKKNLSKVTKEFIDYMVDFYDGYDPLATTDIVPSSLVWSY